FKLNRVFIFLVTLHLCTKLMQGVYTHSTFTNSWENLTLNNSVLNSRSESELTSHTGNVLVVISDRKLPEFDGSNNFTHYTADVVSYSDEYPRHAIMSGRSSNASEYGYGGANAQEKVDELKGAGNHYTAEYWE